MKIDFEKYQLREKEEIFAYDKEGPFVCVHIYRLWKQIFARKVRKDDLTIKLEQVVGYHDFRT